MIKTHDRQGIVDYFKELGMEIRTTHCNNWYNDMICYPTVDNFGVVHLYEIAHVKNDKLYKLNRAVERFDEHGCYWLTNLDKINPTTIPFGKVTEKDCNALIDNFNYQFKQAKIRFKKDKIERICCEEDCD